MKKVLSLVLVLTLVLGSFGFAFADTTKTLTVASDVEGTAFEDAVTVLTALGVVSGYEDGTYKPANIVTRAEMAKLIIAELGLEGSATGSKSTFKDMSGYGWAEGYVGYAQSLGIISGYGDGTFKPGKTVSYDEALTMMVSALGYTKECKEMNGSWPAIYVQKARVLGLTDDVKAGGAVGANRGDVAIMLYNMLTANMGYADADGVYQPKKDKDGVTIKVATNLNVEESSRYQVITEKDAEDAIVNVRNYIGAAAKVFSLTKGKDKDSIIAVSDVKSTFITGTFDGKDIIEAADGTEYKFTKGTNFAATERATEKNESVTYSIVGYEFNNSDSGLAGWNKDTVLADLTLAQDKNYTLAVKLSGKNIDEVYSLATWTADQTAKVDADDLADIKNNQSLLGKDFKLDGNDEIDVTSFDLVGVASLSDIKADNIVYVYANDDSDIVRVAVGTEVVSGEVTKTNAAQNKLTIGGKTYKLADVELTKNGVSGELTAETVDAGDEVKLFLDAYGYAYDYDSISGSADNYAIVLKTGKTGGASSDEQVKLFLADGTTKTFNIDSDAFKKDNTVAGKPIKAIPGLVSTTPNAKDMHFIAEAGTIIKYGVNKNGEIDTLENFADSKDFAGSKYVVANVHTSDISEKGYFGGFEISSNAVIFSYDEEFDAIDGDLTDDGNYSVTTLEKVKDTDAVKGIYILEKNRIKAMLLANYSDSDETYGVVTGRNRTSGDADYSVTMLINGAEKTFTATNGGYDAAEDGDDAKADDFYDKLFRVEFNASGDVKGLVAASSDAANKTFAKAGPITVTSGAVYGDYKNDGKDYFSYNNGRLVINGTPYTVMNGVTIYKNDKGDWKKGSTSDLKSLEGKTIYLYDVEDDGNTVYNYILIK